MHSQQRLHKRQDFITIKEHGRKCDCGSFILRLYVHDTSVERLLPRLGIVASRRVGNAVARNRVKRIFREIFRHNQKPIHRNYDLLIITRQQSLQQSFCALTKQFRKGCERLAAQVS